MSERVYSLMMYKKISNATSSKLFEIIWNVTASGGQAMPERIVTGNEKIT